MPLRQAPKNAPVDFDVAFEKLISWTDYPNGDIKYFSGTATYYKSFVVEQSAIRNPQSAMMLDLGKVAVMARVKLNDKDLGIAWKAPYRVELGKALKPGKNKLEIQVVNLWPNRMIGDEQLPSDREPSRKGQWPEWLVEGKSSPTGRQSFASTPLWRKNDPLLESGLLGPVTIQAK